MIFKDQCVLFKPLEDMDDLAQIIVCQLGFDFVGFSIFPVFPPSLQPFPEASPILLLDQH